MNALLSGSYVEIRYDLMTYGIPVSTLPFTDAGEVKPEVFVDWVENRRKIEAEEKQREASRGAKSPEQVPSLASSIIPGPNDVLMGKKKIAKEHSGNLRFHFLIDKHLGRYDAGTSKREKTEIAMEIVHLVMLFGGRFLKNTSTADSNPHWEEIDPLVARDKVAASFRSRRKATKEQQSLGLSLY